MADDERPHFVIPPEQTYTDAVIKTGFGVRIERPDYGEHGRFLVHRAQEFRATSSAARDSTVSEQLFLEVEVAEATSIRAEKPRLSQVGLTVVSYSTADEHSGTAKIGREDFDLLEGRINRYATERGHPGRSYLSVVEDLRPVPVEQKIPADLLEPTDEVLDAILYLYPGLSARESEGVVEELRRFIVELGGEPIDSHHFSSGVTTVQARVPREGLQALGREFSTLQKVGPNRAYYVGDSTPFAAIPNPLTVGAPHTDFGVALVDSGINPSCALLSPLVSGVAAQLPPGSVGPHMGHGTFVASRVVYGDDLESQLRSGSVSPVCTLHDVPVFGRDPNGQFLGADEHQLAVALDKTLPTLPDKIRVVNLSLGTDQPITDGNYSIVAHTLDYLAREHDLLIVTTSGNVRDPRLISQFPTSVTAAGFRLDPPGESLLAVTVGSIAKFGDGGTFSQLGELSPFSRVGPGSDGGLKPELVAHGGNYVRPGHRHSRFATQGIHGNGRSLAWDVGTSFAAPLVASIAAQIQGSYGGISANLAKALLLHFAEPAAVPAGIVDDGFKVGLGEPQLVPALQAGAHSAAFLFTGELDATSYLHIPFFVPDALGGDHPGSRLRVRCTVVYNPPVNPAEPSEYSQARIAAKLRKPVEVGYRDVAMSNCMRSYLPWNPVVHFDKLFTHTYSAGAWEIRLRLFTRDLPDDFRQAVAVVIEVLDENGTVDVWADISAEAGAVFQPMTVHTAA